MRNKVSQVITITLSVSHFLTFWATRDAGVHRAIYGGDKTPNGIKVKWGYFSLGWPGVGDPFEDSQFDSGDDLSKLRPAFARRFHSGTRTVVL